MSGDAHDRRAGTADKAGDGEAAEQGLNPLQFMLDLLRDESADLADRKWAAAQAAPFIHPKLQTVAFSGEDGGPIQVVHGVDPAIAALIDRIAGANPR